MYFNSPFGRRQYFITGKLWVWHDSQGLDIYNPNSPYAQARMKIVDGEAKLIMNRAAPMHFINEVQQHLDKLKTLLILGG